MRVLVVNAGSSSLKYAVFATPERAALARGLVERLGTPGATLRRASEQVRIEAADHAAAVAAVAAAEGLSGVEAVGHRVVHGGERFTEPTLVDDRVLEALEANARLAPLHNPPNLSGLRATRELFPGRPNVAVFDTSFHATMPPRAFLYAIPRELYERDRVRRYGFHGTSHAFVSREAARMLGRTPEGLKIVTLHLGNGASACAVDGGRSVDTSMGFTPLEGLVMGTRSGDLDPAVALALASAAGADAALETLNRRSGLLGLGGHADVRDLRAAADAGDAWASTALEVYAHRARRYVGALAASMGGLDAVAFAGGVGENDPRTRAAILEGLGFLGLELDPAANLANRPGPITAPGSRAAALVVPTDEEWAIAEATAAVVGVRDAA